MARVISGKTKIYGIFGHPVEHTFSPGMHNAAFRKLGMDACYVPFSVHPSRLRDAVKAVLPLGLCGLNITVPHKEKVIARLDELSEEARLIGAVNTVEVRDGRLVGHNTDGRGFIRSLRDGAGFDPRSKNVLIAGAGGAARAVGFCLALAKAERIVFHDVDAGKATRLARDIRKKTGVSADAISSHGLAAAARDAHCLINATPLGLKKSDPLPLGKELLLPHHLVCDLVYNPPETGLLRAAKDRGARSLSGIGMLLFQGVIAFEIWTGAQAPVAVMKNALTRQLKGRAR
ncbi:MAG TPA: shikimate dehydrogenase [Nitrospirota bacterium]|nr:shikimate dehydrogenase [Nitrospirota bacterium]